MEHEKYSVYIKTDETGRIVAVNSDAFLSSLDGWTKIAEGHGDKFHHAQGNFLDKPLMDDNGVFRFCLKNGKIKERTKKEMAADVQEQPVQPTDRERLDELEKAFEGLNKLYTAIAKKMGLKE